MNERIPKGYQIINVPNYGDWLQKDDGSEFFRLTDRSMAEVDFYFGLLPRQYIPYYIRKNGGNATIIADIPGGRMSAASQNILRAFPNPNLQVVGIDLVHTLDIGTPMPHRVQANARDIPLLSASIDIVFSFQFLEYIKDKDKVLSEMARVLKPGGVALIDDEPLVQSAGNDKILREIEESGSVFFIRKSGNKGDYGRYSTGEPRIITLMVKEPIDYNVLRIQEQVFHI